MGDYAVDRSHRLENAGFTPSIGWKERSIVSVAENGKTYKVSVAPGVRKCKIQAKSLTGNQKLEVRTGKYRKSDDTKLVDEEGIIMS